MQQPKISQNAQAILDQVLDGETPEQRAKILRLVMEMGISPEEEFFAIVLALKSLNLLMQEAPEAWQKLFSDFLRELDLKTESGKQIIAAQVEHIESIAQLADNAQQIQKTLEALTQSTHTFNQYFTNTASTLESTLAQWQQSHQHWEERRKVESKQENVLLKVLVEVNKKLYHLPPKFLYWDRPNSIKISILNIYAVVVTSLLIYLQSVK